MGLVVAFLTIVPHAGAQVAIHYRDAGSGAGPALLQQAVAQPHIVLVASDGEAHLPRDSTYHETVIVLGGDAIVEGQAMADVIVVGGGLYMHPGARIAGRAVAIGGGVYESGLATIAGGVRQFRDFTYDITPAPDGYTLSYRSLIVTPHDPLALLSLLGPLLPTYDRTNGLSVGLAPEFAVPGTTVTLQPRLTYRSELGAFDPSVDVTAEIDSRTELRASVGRGTFTNDTWIRPDILNSLEALGLGEDTRNYFRATRGKATLSRRWESDRLTIEPYVGGRAERAESVRPDFGATGGPWSFFGRHDSLGMLRPNPQIDRGTTESALAGASAIWNVQDIVAQLRIDEELGVFNRRTGDLGPDDTFAQTTADGRIEFPTFSTQTFSMHAHAVLTTHGSTPLQRWAYVGGPSSIPTIDMLSEGGDELLYFDARYNIPIDSVTLPLIGSPVLTVREVLGGAAVGALPALQQASGVRLSASALYGELLVDPTRGRWHFGLGIALSHD
jgi:hypothetical protein